MIALNDYLKGCRIVDPLQKRTYKCTEVDLTVNSHNGQFSEHVFLLKDGSTIESPVIQPCSQIKDCHDTFIYADDIVEMVYYNREDAHKSPVNVDRYTVVCLAGRFFFKPIRFAYDEKLEDHLWSLEPVIHLPSDTVIKVIGNLQTWEDSIPLS